MPWQVTTLKKVSVPNSVCLHIYIVILYIAYVNILFHILCHILVSQCICKSSLFFFCQDRNLCLCSSICTWSRANQLDSLCPVSSNTAHLSATTILVKKNQSFSGVIHTDNLVLIILTSVDINRKRWKDTSDSAHFSIHEEKGCSLNYLLKYHILILLATKQMCIFVLKTWKLTNISVTMWELKNKNWNTSDLQLSIFQEYRQHMHPSWYSTAEKAKGQLKN